VLALVRVLGFGVAFGCLGATAHAEAPVVRLDLEAGSELDTNVHRAVGAGGPAATTPAAGGRLGARAALAWRASRRHALRVRGVAAGKAFAVPGEAAEENVAVFSGDARWEARLADSLGWAALLSYYDAIERHGASNADRDFRTGDAAGALTLLAEGGHRLTATAGYRLFRYKPNPAFDFAGEHAGLTWRKSWQKAEDAPTWDLSLSYNAHRRRYDGGAYINTCAPDVDVEPGCLAPAGMPRVDLFHAAAVELTWTSTRILGARYELQIDDSNSFGQSFLRHRLDLSATTELPRDVFLTAKLVVQINRSLDPVLFTCDACTFLTVEDESRNAIILHLTRDFSDALTLEARGAFYTNAFTTDGVEYRRATLYFGAIYSFGSLR
jgi:hypothetical protein